MRNICAALALSFLSPIGATAAESRPTVLVRLVAARRGEAPVMISAYGQAAPATTAAVSLNIPQPGQVIQVKVTPGQSVRRGAVLLVFATAPSALASYRQAQTALTLARTQRLHQQQLLAQQLATRDQLAVADKAVADAQAQLAALSREGAGRATTILTAPFDAVVTATPVAQGERPQAGAPLVGLARASGLQVTVGVEPGLRREIRLGAPVRLEPVGGGAAVSGRVIRVDAALNTKSRLVDVDIAAPADAVLSGQAFMAQIAVGSRAGWLVPHASVRVEEGRAFLFQVEAGKARRVEVSISQAGRDVDVVEGALNASLPVVVEGAFQLDDGMAVRTR